MSEGNVTGDIENGGQGLSVVHVTISNQPVQVQSGAQSNQPSVIQTAGGSNPVQTIQVVRVANVDEELPEDTETRKRREILARRPSYRKILHDLSSPVSKMDEDSNSSQSQDGDHEAAQNLSSSNSVHYQQGDYTVVPAGTLQLSDGTAVTQGLQTLTMTNSSPPSASAAGTGGATIVQYAQGPDGQFYIPVGGTNVQAYQIATSLPQGVVMASAGSPMSSPPHMSEEGSRKRELRLLKNREAARECRRKKKEYVKCLENRVAVLENQNKTLIEELKALKELYCQKEG
ncbi:hypothetical protein ACOMHN_051442 [Nucella lapillus]